MKVLYIIVALWTGGDGEDFYRFTDPTFETKEECVAFTKQSYFILNRFVNDEHNSDHPYPNTFYCISEKEWLNQTGGKSI